MPICDRGSSPHYTDGSKRNFSFVLPFIKGYREIALESQGKSNPYRCGIRVVVHTASDGTIEDVFDD
jgi:hypothetical protein